MNIIRNFETVKQNIPPGVELIAVSKTRPEAEILELYNYGQRDFGENRVQELCKKRELLPGEIRWHMIGHLQTNKVRQILPFVYMIQSVDSFRLLNQINTEAKRINRVVDCLLQVFIADEKTKFGFSPVELQDMLESAEFPDMKNVRVRGLMGMATLTNDMEKIRKEFQFIAGYFQNIKKTFFNDDPGFRELSTGMSGDYQLAIKFGSTMVRIGSLIFAGN